eukprot:jgi/Ulvmu1/9935/UM058_0018.1
MDDNSRPLLDDGGVSLSEVESSLGDLASDNFSSALVGSVPKPDPQPESAIAETQTQYDRIGVTLSEDAGRQFGQNDNGASASAQWHGQSVSATMALLMMLSSAQMLIGLAFLQELVGIPPLITSLLGVLVGFGHMMGYIPGDHLEKQVRLVKSASIVAIGINSLSIGIYTYIVVIIIAEIRDWSLDLDFIVAYLIFWCQTILFVRIELQARAVLHILHPETC